MRSISLFTIVLFVVLLSVGIITPTASAADNDVEISGAVSAETGEQTIIVRLTGQSESEVRATGASQLSGMKTHATNTQSELITFAEENSHISVVNKLWLTNAVVMKIDTEQVSIDQIAAIDHVERIHEDYPVSTVGTATSTNRSQFIGLSNGTSSAKTTDTSASTTNISNVTRSISRIGAPAVWETYRTRGEGIRVAVIDTGVNSDHPDIDISDKNWICKVDCGDKNKPHDATGHGTHVSGTIVGGDDNDAEIHIGTAPEATLMHAKALGKAGKGNVSTVIDSMEWAVENDADIITMSLGAEGLRGDLVDPARNAQKSDVTVVAAIGNGGKNTFQSPGAVYDTVSVGSVDIKPAYPEQVEFRLSDDTVSNFSGGGTINRDDWEDPPTDWPESYVVPDVTAPGAVIWSADANLRTQTCGKIQTKELTCLSGTSMATPHVAGVAALMQASTDSTLSPEEIQSKLRSTAVDIDAKETRQGAGRIDAEAAVSAVAGGDAFFKVNITSAPGIIKSGEQYNIGYSVTNNGSTAGNQSITTIVNGSVIGTTPINLTRGDSTNRTISHQLTKTTDEPTEIIVSSDDSSANVTVHIIPSDFPGTAVQFNSIDQNSNSKLGSIEIAQAIKTNSIQGNVNDVDFSSIMIAKIITWNSA